MKSTLFVIAVLGILISCNDSDTAIVTVSATAPQLIDTVKNKLQRQSLIEQLKNLQNVLATDDKVKIADLFPFPLSNKDFDIDFENNAFDQQLKLNGNKITKEMFLQYFQQIDTAIQIDNFNILFKHLKLDSLLYKDTLEYADYIKTDPCYPIYRIGVEKSKVQLRIDMHSNADYKGENISTDETAENDAAFCEHMFWWIFEFDGKKLILKDIDGAD